MKRWIHSKFADECRDYFLTQIGVDIDVYRDDSTYQFDKRNMICIDWDSMSKTEQQLMMGIAVKDNCPYNIENAGSWMKCISRR